MGQMCRHKLMGHVGHGSEGVDHVPSVLLETSLLWNLHIASIPATRNLWEVTYETHCTTRYASVLLCPWYIVTSVPLSARYSV